MASYPRRDWIEGWSDDLIGGRAIDISQIAWSLERSIKAAFPINGVPTNIAEKLQQLVGILDQGENAIDSLIGEVSRLLDARDGV